MLFINEQTLSKTIITSNLTGYKTIIEMDLEEQKIKLGMSKQ